MTQASYQLAQVNIARLVAPLDDPRVADFVANLERLNALADAAPGFVWRLQTEAGDATGVRAYADDRLIVNLSVWESLAALQEFTYRSAHVEIMRRRREWFETPAGAYLALWWIEAGQRPTIEEAQARLAHLEQHGATAYAFTFKQPFVA